MGIDGVDVVTFKPDGMLLSDNGSIFQWYSLNLVIFQCYETNFPIYFYPGNKAPDKVNLVSLLVIINVIRTNATLLSKKHNAIKNRKQNL